jgi:replicative DNA helicase
MKIENYEILFRIAEATHNADTASSLAESLRALDNTDIEQSKDFINELCKLRGIDPTSQELVEINRLCKEAKEKAQRQTADAKIKNTLAAIITEAHDTLERLNKGVSPTDPKNKDAITEVFKTINNNAAALFSNTSTIEREATWEGILQAWKKDTEVDFAPDIFDKLAFPNSTVSYIGARTGRGKTTAMVNIGIEALFPTDEKTTPRRVLFVSLEESLKQIARRFALCLAYRNADDTQCKDLLEVTNPYTDQKDPKNAYKNFMHNVPNGGKGAKTFVDCMIKANETLAKLIGKGDLAIFNGIGASFAEIMARIRQCERGDVVVFDYIQKIPANGEIHGGNPDLERIRIGSQELINAAAITESVIIAGAQLNRESQGGSGNVKKDDTFTDADFRGCGDLEQDAHNAIGIGRTANKMKTYYGIIKTREDALTDGHWELDFRGGYSYMRRTDTLIIPNEKIPKAEKDKKPNNETKPATKEVILKGIP